MRHVSGLVTLLSLALGASLLGVTTPAEATRSPAAAAAPAAPAVPVITWEGCEDFGDLEGAPECATVPVPLDYDEPEGATVDLDLLRMPATDPDRRIGTLFVNPGGPGAPSSYFALVFGDLVPDEVSARFDIVGIDPRGTGSSAPAVCRKPGRHPDYPYALFPYTKAQIRTQLGYDRWLRSACRTGGAPIVDHLTTADTARDMDLIRQAVGDEQLTYYGISYGTQLGSTYAALFPDNVRAMILDGVLDPVAWSTGRPGTTGQPFSERIGSGTGAWLALVNALAECDRVGPQQCAIGGRASQTWRDLVRRLRQGPFEGLTYPDLVASALMSLYDPRSVPRLMRALGKLHRALKTGGPAPRLLTERPQLPGRRAIPGPYTPYTPYAAPGFARGGDPFLAIACADTDNPSDPQAWVAAGRRSDRRSPWFGAAWSWRSSACAGWPARTQADRFTGPFAVTPSAPVLVVGNTYDPATPLSGARAVNRLLDGSRLLVLDGWGHGALDTGPCIGQAYRAYLIDGTLPAPGTVCQPKRPLFGR